MAIELLTTNKYESAVQSFDLFLKSPEVQKGDRNEATTRLHLIDRLFFDVLGWAKEDSYAEDYYDGTYADYIFSAPRRSLVVEAKREGRYFDIPGSLTDKAWTIKALIDACPDLESPIDQVINYARDRSLRYALITNGHQFVFMLGSRDDGVDVKSGRALVWRSLEAVREDFAGFWSCLSQQAIGGHEPYTLLTGAGRPTLPPKPSSSILGYPGNKDRNIFQADLRNVSEIAIEDIPQTKAMRREILEHAYCDSGALSQYTLLSKQILQSRYHDLENDNSGPDTLSPAVTRDGISAEAMWNEAATQRPIILVGSAGVGKSTFLLHLLEIDAEAILKDDVTMYVDMASSAAFSSDLEEHITSQVEAILLSEYDIDIRKDEFVRNVYLGELKQFRTGIFGKLYDIDRVEYLRKEIDFLDTKTFSNTVYVQDALQYISKFHRRGIVIALDNADRRESFVQERLFVLAEEIAKQWPCTVFVSLRPETFLTSSKKGVLDAYHIRAFTISPPKIECVLTKRLELARKIAVGELNIPSLPQLSVQMSSLQLVIDSFLYSIDDSPELMECIENCASGNIRRGLELVRKFFGSGHVDSEKIATRMGQKDKYTIPLHEFLRALIFGDHVYYSPGHSLIVNIFDVNHNKENDHFTKLALLQLLNEFKDDQSNFGFREYDDVYDRMQQLGFTVEQVDTHMVQLIDSGLIETSYSLDVADQVVAGSKGRITSLGAYHSLRLVGMFAYIDAIWTDIPYFKTVGIVNYDNPSIDQRGYRVQSVVGYLNSCLSGSDDLRKLLGWNQVMGKVNKDIQKATRGSLRSLERNAERRKLGLD